MDPNPNAPALFDDTNPYITYTSAGLWIRSGAQGEHNSIIHDTAYSPPTARRASPSLAPLSPSTIYTACELASAHILDNIPLVTFTPPPTPTPPTPLPPALNTPSSASQTASTLLITTVIANRGFGLNFFAITGPTSVFSVNGAP